MLNFGIVLMGIGRVKGENRVEFVVRVVIISFFLDMFIEGVMGVLYNIVGFDLIFLEISMVFELIKEVVDFFVNIKFGV